MPWCKEIMKQNSIKTPIILQFRGSILQKADEKEQPIDQAFPHLEASHQMKAVVFIICVTKLSFSNYLAFGIHASQPFLPYSLFTRKGKTCKKRTCKFIAPARVGTSAIVFLNFNSATSSFKLKWQKLPRTASIAVKKRAHHQKQKTAIHFVSDKSLYFSMES